MGGDWHIRPVFGQTKPLQRDSSSWTLSCSVSAERRRSADPLVSWSRATSWFPDVSAFSYYCVCRIQSLKTLWQHAHDLPLVVTNVLHSLFLFLSVKNFHQNKSRFTSLRFCSFYCKDKSRKGLHVTLWFHILKSMGDVEKQTEFILRFMQESFLQSDLKKLSC